MKDKVKISDIGIDYQTGKPKITFLFNNKDILSEIETLKDVDISIEVKKWRNKRSLDANAYCFVLCQKLAEKLNITKIEVYRKAISEVGQFQIVPIRDDATETFIEAWISRGLGWICENLGACKNTKGYSNIICYYGSSIYSTYSMSLLINNLVEECKLQGIETKPQQEIESMLNEWGA